MHPEHTELFRRITEFAFDEPGTVLTFPQRLARENGWAPGYAVRVIAEYRKFVLLAMAAGHPVSPSDQVDQAWHMHLTSTESYWDRFCPEVLGRPLHHYPSKGGREESAKLRKWYGDTLASYRTLFGTAPPADIWPPADVRFGDDLHFVRVNTRRAWVVCRAMVRGLLALVLLLAALGTVAGCAPVEAFTFPTISGPEYLRLYLWGVGLAAVLSLILRWLLRGPGGNPPVEAEELHPWEVARLAGGRKRTAQAAIASLVHGETIEAVRDDRCRWVGCGTPYSLKAKGRLPRDAHPIEQAIVAAVKARPDGLDAWGAERAARPEVLALEQRLAEFGLLDSTLRTLEATFCHLLPFGCLLALGVNRVLHGIERGRPVGYLTSLLVWTAFLTAVWTIVSMLLWTRRSRRGDRVVRRWKRENSYLWARVRERPERVDAASLGLAVGLFGPTVLAGQSDEALRNLWSALYPVQLQGGGGSDGGSSMWTGGGGGCGGGGGGGGGGGCGGCGG